METLIRLLAIFHPISKRLSLCSHVGFIAGTLSGFVIANLAWVFKGLYFTNRDAFLNSLVLTLFVWLIILFILCIQIRFTFKSVALPSLLNCFLTCLLTAFISKWLNAYSLAWLVGMLVGVFVGMMLCRINSLVNRG